MTRLRADALLLLAAFIWGTAFIAQKAGNDTIGPLLFVGGRFLLSAILIAPLALYEAKKQTIPLTRRDFKYAGLISLSLFMSASLQQIGLLTTTATNGGFLTALYVIAASFAAWLLTRQRPTYVVALACCLSILGAWLLTHHGQTGRWTIGDCWLIIADIGWGFQITLISLFLKTTNRPFFLSFVQYAGTAILAIVIGLVFEPLTEQVLFSALPSLLYAGIVSGGIAYTLQIIAQRYTPAAEGALIMSSESVFAAFSGALMFQERLTMLAFIGCILILLSAVMVEASALLNSWLERTK